MREGSCVHWHGVRLADRNAKCWVTDGNGHGQHVEEPTPAPQAKP